MTSGSNERERPRWRITGRHEEARFPVFAVERVSLARGETPLRDAYVLRTRNWCSVLAVTPDDEVLFVRQFRFGVGRETLELPGGVIDDGEEPLAAARRELREETGHESSAPFELLVDCAVNPPLQNTRFYSYLVRQATPSVLGTSFDELEECELVKVPLRELGERLDRGEIEHSLCRLPLEIFLRRGG